MKDITIKGIRDAEMLNETIYMYAHDALIHYLMPHGLEQQSGAAWGTRDICQGPFEFLLSFAHYDALRNILLNIFAHQSIETGQWSEPKISVCIFASVSFSFKRCETRK